MFSVNLEMHCYDCVGDNSRIILFFFFLSGLFFFFFLIQSILFSMSKSINHWQYYVKWFFLQRKQRTYTLNIISMFHNPQLCGNRINICCRFEISWTRYHMTSNRFFFMKKPIFFDEKSVPYVFSVHPLSLI